ncbi:MAG TPA: hypothetical protein VIF09_03590, partial [Polyangiaceae bacterium]
MGRACAAGMHALTFMAKRAHWRGVVFGRRAVEEHVPEMTPARFDLLFVIRNFGGVRQPEGGG